MKQCIRSAMVFVISLIVLSLSVISQTNDAGAADKVIKIGVMAPMKFIFGELVWRGAQMAADEINAAGGAQVKGVPHKIELIQADDNCLVSIPDAISAIERLITVKKVDIVLGGYRSEAVLAQQEIAADHKTIFMGAGGGCHPELAVRVAKDYERYKYYFRGTVSSIDLLLSELAQVDGILKTIRSELGIKKPKVALLIDKAKWADPVAELAQVLFPKLGAEVVGSWRPGYSASNVTSELSAIKRAGAHMIFESNAGPAGNVIARQWGELKIPAALGGINTEGMKSSHWKTTNGFCNYMEKYMYVNRVAITEKTIPFFDAFFKRYGEEPMHFACIAYDNLFVFKEAIERAGTLKSDSVVAELEKTDYLGTTGRIAYTPREHKWPHDIIWGPKHVPITAGQWRDGKQMAIWPDAHEIDPALIAAGAPSGWKGVKFEGTVDYELPPWVKTYWKGKK